MTALFFGAAAFALMALADWLGALRHMRGAALLFPLGCAALAGATVWLAAHRLRAAGLPDGARAIVCLGLAACALALLMHTLFFALPVAGSGALPPTSGKQPLAHTGVYALCRHPGVLWLGAFYLALWGALGGAPLGWAFALFTGLDTAYVLWQDKKVFPHTIENYAAYQRDTPFLIPHARSVRACAATWGRRAKTCPGKKKGS